MSKKPSDRGGPSLRGPFLAGIAVLGIVSGILGSEAPGGVLASFGVGLQYFLILTGVAQLVWMLVIGAGRSGVSSLRRGVLLVLLGIALGTTHWAAILGAAAIVIVDQVVKFFPSRPEASRRGARASRGGGGESTEERPRGKKRAKKA